MDREVCKDFLLPLDGVVGLCLGVAAFFLRDEQCDLLAGLVVGLLREGLFFTFEAAFEGLGDEFAVEVVETAVSGLCEAHAHGPAERVLLIA